MCTPPHPLISWKLASSHHPAHILPCLTLLSLVQSPAAVLNLLKSLWNLILQAGRAPFSSPRSYAMMKNWHSSMGLLCYCCRAFSRPWCLLDVSSGILTPLTQLPMADCPCVMFNSWVTINAICPEALFLRENVFRVFKLNSEHFFQIRSHLYWQWTWGQKIRVQILAMWLHCSYMASLGQDPLYRLWRNNCLTDVVGRC